MTETETPRVFGRPAAEAAAALASTDGPDPATVEEEIALFVEDGIVSRDRVDDAVAGLAKVVSTPETRVEVAAREVDRAHEAAADAADLGVVAHRLDALDERLAAVETEVRTLGGRLSTVLDDAKDPAALYETARAVRALTDDANAAQLAADSLRDDAEATVEWARAHETRTASSATTSRPWRSRSTAWQPQSSGYPATRTTRRTPSNEPIRVSSGQRRPSAFGSRTS